MLSHLSGEYNHSMPIPYLFKRFMDSGCDIGAAAVGVLIVVGAITIYSLLRSVYLEQEL